MSKSLNGLSVCAYCWDLKYPPIRQAERLIILRRESGVLSRDSADLESQHLDSSIQEDLFQGFDKEGYGSRFSDIAESASRGCASCGILKNGITAFVGEASIGTVHLSMQKPTAIKRDPTVGVLLRATSGVFALDFYTDDVRVTKKWPLVSTLSHVSSVSSHPSCLAKAKKWIQHCVKEHSGHCYDTTESLLPRRIIAVGGGTRNPFLYESQPGETGPYATLSYCWGDARVFTTTKATLSKRKDGFQMQSLPKTCRDAVFLARALKIPYLWIDSLCIIQDEREDWHREAESMCEIYSNSFVTFAALDSPHSDAGLFEPHSDRKTIIVPIALSTSDSAKIYVRNSYGNLRHRFTHGGLPDTLVNTPTTPVLETRGWTLQELTLSPRILWTSSLELGFSCTTEAACECQPRLRTYQPRDETLEKTRVESTTEKMSMWRRLIEEFTKRELKFNEDRLPAMAGLAKSLHGPCGGRYFAGLFELTIMDNLLWVSELRGMFSMIAPSIADDYAPSWSWASVSGKVTFPLDIEKSWPEMIWKGVLVDFNPRSTNRYGGGFGTIVIESIVLPLRLGRIEGLTTAVPITDLLRVEAIFSKMPCFNSVWIPDIRPQNQSRPVWQTQELVFLCAYLNVDISKTVISFSGLVLERKGVGFIRIGAVFIEKQEIQRHATHWWDTVTRSVVHII